jgi:hypothetical protein
MRAARRSTEITGYLVAALALVIGGVFLRTPVLNWICGPAIVVAAVVGVGMLTDRFQSRNRP